MASLSFGIEFELALIYAPEPTSDWQDPHPEDSREVVGLQQTHLIPSPPNSDINDAWMAGMLRNPKSATDTRAAIRTHLANSFMTVGLNTRVDNFTWEQDPVMEPGSSVDTKADDFVYDPSPPQTKWTVKQDDSVDAGVEPYDFTPIEITSPAMWCGLKAFRDLRLASETLRQNYRIVLNGTMGLHCHVGQGAEGFSLQVCQNLFAFLWTFEPILSTLHTEARAKSMWAASLRESTNLQNFLPYPKWPFDAVRLIFATTNKQQRPSASRTNLAYLWARDEMGRAAKTAYYFGHLEDRQRPTASSKKTIEFRGHAGTLDSDAVEHWAKVCIGIVDYCRSLHAGAMFDLCVEHCKREEQGMSLSVGHLLRMIGCVEQATYYERREA